MNNTKKKSDAAAILDELRSEDPKKRTNAVSNIKDVAAALGPARVRSELIGFLACTSFFIQNSLMTKSPLFWNF